MMCELVDVTGIDKAELLMALYNNASPQGMGFLHYTPEDMTYAEAAGFVKLATISSEYSGKDVTYFDYLHGRVMKIDIAPDKINPHLYDRDNVETHHKRSVKEVVALLRATKNV